MTDLEEYAVTLDMFPHLDEYDRAVIFSAIDLAPETAPDTLDLHDNYFDSNAYHTWKLARKVVLDSSTGNRWAVDLAEAAGYASVVTKDDILAALHRGKMLVTS